MAKDDTLEIVSDSTLNQYVQFLESLDTIGQTSPPIVLMSEMLGVGTNAATGYWNSTTTAMYNQMRDEIMNVDGKAFNFGAAPDTLSADDADYLHPDQDPNDDDAAYSGFEVSDGDDGTRKLRNSDAVLGKSRDQLRNELAGTPEKTRVFYLNPATYGGNYLNPPLYIRPAPNTGWLGMVDSVFPEISPCKPYRTEVVDFSKIEKEMMNSYSGLSEDKRLKGEPRS